MWLSVTNLQTEIHRLSLSFTSLARDLFELCASHASCSIARPTAALCTNLYFGDTRTNTLFCTLFCTRSMIIHRSMSLFKNSDDNFGDFSQSRNLSETYR